MTDLQLEKPLQRGNHHGQVKLAQEWLCLHNRYVLIDGEFGPATESAVKDFQRASKLPVTGIIDDATLDQLIAPMKLALDIISINGRTLGQLVVAYAKQHLKQHPCEIGGQNRGPWVRLYMNGNEGQQWAWCAGFACFCLKQACATLQQPLPIRPSFSCDAIAFSANSNGRLVDYSDARPGSFFLMRNTPDDWTHVGIVISKNVETFKTIEGNTNDDGSREGYEVCSRTRGINKMDFIKI